MARYDPPAAAMVPARWLATVLVGVFALMHGEVGHGAGPAALLVLAGVAALNLELARRADEPLPRRVAGGVIAADLTALTSIVLLYEARHTPDLWPLLLIVPIEAALWFGVRGALAGWLGVSVTLVVREVWVSVDGDVPTDVAGMVQRIGAAAVISAAAALLTRLLQHERADAAATAEALADVVSAAGAVVWEADLATRRVNLARGVREQLGEGPAVETTVDAGRLTARVHPDDLPLLLDAYTRAAAGEPAEVSYRVRVADRGFRWLQDNVGPLRAPDGTVIGVRGVAVDVTPQRAAAEAELAVARRFAALLEHSSDVVTVIDLQARITYMSPSSERVVGWRAGELTGQLALSLIHPDDVPLVAGRLLEIASKQGEHLSEEYRFRHADGSWRWVESVAHNLLDDPLVGGIVVNTRDVQERHELEARLEHQAGHDPLTGLVNRALFEDRLEHALARASRTARPLGLLFADLDDFKLVNDRYGHAVGDEVLRVVSLRLERGVRAGDTVARYGGDEFVVLCEDLTSPGEADELADRLRCAVGRPVPTRAGPVSLEVSVGVALLDHDHAGHPDAGAAALVIAADQAMYAVKARRRLGPHRRGSDQPPL